MNQGEKVSVKRVVANVIRNLDISDASRSFFNSSFLFLTIL